VLLESNERPGRNREGGCGGIDGGSAAKAAATRDVEVIPLSRYSRGRVAQEGLQLGFAAVDAGEIRRGVRELAVSLIRTTSVGARPASPRCSA
jgi:DNA-binding transcriptional MocR family regulator